MYEKYHGCRFRNTNGTRKKFVTAREIVVILLLTKGVGDQLKVST